LPDDADNLRAQQMAFAAHLRDPDSHPAPAGIEDRRMKIYRDLFLGNLVSLLGSSFPVLRKILGEDRFRKLVRQFLKEHRSHTPIFAEVPEEFVSFLQARQGHAPDDPPFLLELAHYEWADVALKTRDFPIDWETIDPAGDLLTGIPVVSPMAWPLAYQFPVHRITADFQPNAPDAQPTRLLVYRSLNDVVGFIEMNAVTARLIELADDNPQHRSGRQLLLHIAAELGHPDVETVIAGGLQILTRMREKDVFLGTRRS
jgi:hypothetical protein